MNPTARMRTDAELKRLRWRNQSQTGRKTCPPGVGTLGRPVRLQWQPVHWCPDAPGLPDNDRIAGGQCGGGVSAGYGKRKRENSRQKQLQVPRVSTNIEFPVLLLVYGRDHRGRCARTPRNPPPKWTRTDAVDCRFAQVPPADEREAAPFLHTPGR